MVYLGRVILQLNREEFWESTPREIIALLGVYLELHGEGKPKRVFIDQVF